jgi:type I restriction enzyme R subunit
MPSNFDFLQSAFPDLYPHALQAESLVFSAPRASCFYARFALEQTVKWLYANDPYLKIPYDTNLAALIHEQTFKDNLKPGLFPKIRAIHKLGNLAVHDATVISDRDALNLVQELFHVLYWLARYYGPSGRTLPDLTFQREQVPHPAEAAPDLSLQQLQALEQKLVVLKL